MGKQILITLAIVVALFLVLAFPRYLSGSDNWLVDTLNWVIPVGLGYFLGYGQGRKN